MILSDSTFELMTSHIYDIYIEVSANYERKSLDEHVNGAFATGEGMEAMDRTMIRLHSIVRCILADGRTYDEVKKDLLYVANRITLRYVNTNKHLSPAEKLFKQFVLDKIEQVRAKQMKENALETSTITGCAIIAPYAGTITKPSPSIITQNMSSVNLRGRAGDEMNEMFRNPNILDRIIPYSNILTDIGGPERVHDVMAMLNESRRINPDLTVAVIYYAWAFIHKNALFLPIKEMSLYLENIECLKDISLKSAVESFAALLPANEASLLSHLQDYDNLSKYMSSPVAAKQAGIDSTELDNCFDLTPLMNFIFSSRRFFPNDYTNSAFMTSSVIGGYSFYKNFLIIQPKSPAGEDLDYIYIPVIDELDEGHVVVIKYWRDAHMDILSEAQYRDETRVI